MGTLITILVIILVIWLWPFIMRLIAPYFQRWMMGKMEDRFRRMAGMPTRKEEKKQRKREAREGRQRQSEPQGAHREPIIPKDYAEDVEFVEIKSYSETEIIREESADGTETVYENQIEDVEFTEIKISGEKAREGKEK